MFAKIRIEVYARLGTALLRIISATLRWHLIGESPFIGKQKRIFIFWHDRQLVMPFAYIRYSNRVNRLATLISEHSDGRMVARFLALVGLQSIAGSSTHGGVRGLRQLIAFVKAGDHVSATPDGPRGPRHVLKPGVLKISQKTGVPIRCLALGFSHQWTFRSWDKLILPKPFSRAYLASGTDIYVPNSLSDAELEEFRVKVENDLRNLTDEIDRFAHV